MKKIKLQSMVDFVLEQVDKLKSESSSHIPSARLSYIRSTSLYAKFLKQPLTLGMFVPCDENGKVLEEPENPKKSPEHMRKYDSYVKAKERVLFEGFYLEHNSVMTPQGGYLDVGNLKQKTVETIVGANLTLTQSAIKQIGLNERK